MNDLGMSPLNIILDKTALRFLGASNCGRIVFLHRQASCFDKYLCALFFLFFCPRMLVQLSRYSTARSLIDKIAPRHASDSKARDFNQYCCLLQKTAALRYDILVKETSPAAAKLRFMAPLCFLHSVGLRLWRRGGQSRIIARYDKFLQVLAKSSG
jgi:hypothetical protein